MDVAVAVVFAGVVVDKCGVVLVVSFGFKPFKCLIRIPMSL